MPRTQKDKHSACGPGWELFQQLSGTVDIELSKKTVPLGSPMSMMVRAVEGAKVRNVSFTPQVYLRNRQDGEEPFRDLTAKERKLVAYAQPSIRVSSYACITPSRVIEHPAPNGKHFTIDDLIDVVERQELQTRDETDWFGGVDCHHVFYEGLHLQKDGTWQIYWGS